MIVDLHTHILPGVDDGAYRMDDAVELARMAVQSGVSTVVATPHYRYYGHDNRAQIVDAYERLLDTLAYEQIPLKVVLGAEIWVDREHMPAIAAEMTYPGTNWFLVEFSVDAHPESMNSILQKYAQEGFLPVIAHPERYLALQQDPVIARDWVKNGWGVQLNRDSLMGLFGKHCYYCAEFMLRQGWANLIASDAHWVQERNTDWQDAVERLTQEFDPQIIRKCIKENPAKILQGKTLI